MIDQSPNWRNQKWYFDADYTERDSVPILTELIEKFGLMVDETYCYILHGKNKQYVVRFPHWGGTRWNPRTMTERPRRFRKGEQLKLLVNQT